MRLCTVESRERKKTGGEIDTHTPHSIDSLSRSTTRGGHTRGGDEREGQEEGERGEEAGEGGRGRGPEEEAQGQSQGERDNTRMHGMRLHDS